MTASNFTGAAGSDNEPLANDLDPRFDAAAAGIDPPRAEAAARSAQAQFDEIAEACRGWVRGNPLQAIGLAAGIGFLLGRSGR